ncbi:2-deoxyribose-5-phosphate aldolase [Kordiimonas sediminis]|uniref:Deoxyribose-phosphate aldolase n=1 Tax=Kordiimonas sediminis TaxID=1735581 RepID=A0A919AZ39_9PROT|nr:deoxyribose-phosphate aldolase [Kordiimonas sediminis]GHF30437.1 2-deoxyribose-5-phosphate aldolase [Kordiimonas sediminis]
MSTNAYVNDGIPFDPAVLEGIRVNKSATERRIASLGGRRAVKKDAQLAFMLKAISCIDLTTLSGDDTPGKVQRMCRKARNPVRHDIMEALGVGDLSLTTGAVCVYHPMVKVAVSTLQGSAIPVAAVSTGFPAGLAPMETRLEEVRRSVADGATEIDIVITREHALLGNWQALYDEVRAFKDVCGEAHMKTILATGQLASLTQIAKASMVSMMAGSDFIKTSTGMEGVNATLPVSLTMIRQIRDYLDMTGIKVGYKPAGGIKTAKDAVLYLVLMKEELGREWLEPELFRFGASSLLGDLERQLEYHAFGGYSAAYRHALG